MKYYLIVGEASGDLHASRLMRSLKKYDELAEFRFFGGDLMAAEGGTRVKHYKELAYMGFVPVLLHLGTIFSNMKRCKEDIVAWKPDVVILVDYPGFNLNIAKFLKKNTLIPVYYYISPKIWAWKEHRIQAIRRDVDRLFSILPFEIDFFEGKHHYPISYVGNPSVDEVSAYVAAHGAPKSDGQTIALLPGSRRQEIADNLSRMLQAALPFSANHKLIIAKAPAIESDFYSRIISASGIDASRVQMVSGETYALLSHATAALVTSGTATLETALFRVPRVVCYYMRCGWFISRVRPYFLKVPFISLVNLIAGREVVPELVADGMNVENVRAHLSQLLPADSPVRLAQLQGYEEMANRLGEPGAPERAASEIIRLIKTRKKS